MSAYQLALKNISKCFGDTTALDHITFDIQSGRHLAIIGSSGCGKSTLLRLIAGLMPLDTGKILIDGVLVSSTKKINVPPHQRNIGMVFQDLALWANLSVFDNISLALSAKKMSKPDIKIRIDEVLKLCGVSTLKGRKPVEISGGQQQRVALARAIALRPHFLLLDEPFSGLDLITKQRLMTEITQLASDQNITLILVTHDPFEASFLAQDAIILEEGKITESGDYAEILKQSSTPLMKQFRSHIRGAVV